MLGVGYDVPVTVLLRLRGIIDVWRFPLLSRHTPVATESDPTGLVTVTNVIAAATAFSRRRAGSGNETRPTKFLTIVSSTRHVPFIGAEQHLPALQFNQTGKLGALLRGSPKASDVR
jgi:hypothetical protein